MKTAKQRAKDVRKWVKANGMEHSITALEFATMLAHYTRIRERGTAKERALLIASMGMRQSFAA
jgi:hypothetical protein